MHLREDCLAAAVLFSDHVMEVPAGHFHSSPTHKGHPHLKKDVFFFFCFLVVTQIETVFIVKILYRCSSPLMQTECQLPVAT